MKFTSNPLYFRKVLVLLPLLRVAEPGFPWARGVEISEPFVALIPQLFSAPIPWEVRMVVAVLAALVWERATALPSIGFPVVSLSNQWKRRVVRWPAWKIFRMSQD